MLIDEQPIQCLPSLAVKLGSDGAMLVQQVHYWCKIAEKSNNQRNFKQSEWWTHHTIDEWIAELPWIKRRTMERLVSRLQEVGVLVAVKFDASNWQHDKWYRVDYKALDSFLPESANTGASNAANGTDSIPPKLRELDTANQAGSSQRDYRETTENIPSGAQHQKGNKWLAILYDSCKAQGKYLTDDELKKYGAGYKRLQAGEPEHRLLSVVGKHADRIISGGEPSPQQVFSDIFGPGANGKPKKKTYKPSNVITGKTEADYDVDF